MNMNAFSTDDIRRHPRHDTTCDVTTTKVSATVCDIPIQLGCMLAFAFTNLTYGYTA